MTSVHPKINLFLRVTGSREDGMHTLETLFVPLSGPCDKLSVTFPKEASSSLSVEGFYPNFTPDCPPEKELSVRAVTSYCRAAHLGGKYSVTLEKHIPVAAGMGGGSADAAYALMLMQEKYHLLSQDELRTLAASIGADVAYFLDPVPSVATGIGEICTPLDFSLPEMNVLIAWPLFPVSAAWGYKNMDYAAAKSDKKTLSRLLDALKAGDVSSSAKLMRNDLAPALEKKFPLLGMMKDAFAEAGAFASMVSGSGPVVFGVFPSEESAEKAQKFFSEKFSSSVKTFTSKVL